LAAEGEPMTRAGGPKTDQARAPRARRPRAVEPFFRSAVLWTVHFAGRRVTAELWTITGLGIDLRYLADGILQETQLFRGPSGNTDALVVALEKREQLERDGWRR
jgi:hypothetical protein